MANSSSGAGYRVERTNGAGVIFRVGDIKRKKASGLNRGEKSARDTEVGEKSLDRYL